MMELAACGARRGKRGTDALNMGWHVTVKVAHERGRQVQSAHEWQGHRFLHSRRATRSTARSGSAVTARRRWLLSIVGCALRAYGYRQCAPLAANAGGATRKRAVERSVGQPI